MTCDLCGKEIPFDISVRISRQHKTLFGHSPAMSYDICNSCYERVANFVDSIYDENHIGTYDDWVRKMEQFGIKSKQEQMKFLLNFILSTYDLENEDKEKWYIRYLEHAITLGIKEAYHDGYSSGYQHGNEDLYWEDCEE